MKHLTVGLGFAWLASAALAQTVYVNGMAPNWDQPYDYPDAFDASGPGPEPNPNQLDPWDAWCTPTSAAMVIAHWEDVRGFAGLADGFADGNQARIPPGYTGPLWNNANNPELWHDRTADGSAARGARPVNDFGWYMDTNRMGANLGNGAHVGTYYKDVAVGLNNFFAAVGAPAAGLSATTWGVNAVFGSVPVPVLAQMLKAEVDANRTAIAHFSYWNVLGPPGPGQGASTDSQESDFGYGDYTWGNTQQGGLHGEQWNFEDGSEGLGHSVAVVGYTMSGGAVTHLIVHDNWPQTVRNVRVPVGVQLVGITTVVPEPASMVGLLVGAGALLARGRRLRKDR